MLESRGTILVTGARGMLAGHLIPKLISDGGTVVLSDRDGIDFLSGRDANFPVPFLESNLPVAALDITDENAVRGYIQECRPSWIVNCAAFTAVDVAESSYSKAFEVNSIGPANLARAAAEIGSKVLHISSDYVFGNPSSPSSRRDEPYTEESPLNPSGLYGESKRFGDELVMALLPESHLILRTSWLHGLFGPNFVTTIAKAAAERDELRVVSDQRGCPTWADWLAGVIVKMLGCDAVGLYNACSADSTSWYEFAQLIVHESGLRTRVLPQTTTDSGRPAPRPRYSVLGTERLSRFLGEDCISWKTGVSEHLAALRRIGEAHENRTPDRTMSPE